MRVKSICGVVLVMSAALLATGQTNLPLQAGAPGYSSSSAGTVAPEPEGGTVESNSYTNHYFELSYPLLPDWREDYKGPLPSAAGYYVLSELRTKGTLNGTFLIAAQDTFFGPAIDGPLDLLKRTEKQAISSTLKIESAPHEVMVGDRTFERLDYSGAGLHHTIFATDIRCHVITFEITTRDLDVVENLDRNMAKLSVPRVVNAATGGGEFPVCVKAMQPGRT